MPRQETAIEEIKGRISTLGSQAAHARTRAKELTEEAATETANAEQMERMQREYVALLDQAPREITIHSNLNGTRLDQAALAKQIAARAKCI